MSVRGAIAGFAAASLTLSSTAAFAAPTNVPEANPWAVLTALSDGAPAAAMCGSAASTSNPASAPRTTSDKDRDACVLPLMDETSAAIPPPQPPPWETPLLVGLFAIASAAGIYLAFNAGNHGNSPV